MSRGFVLIALLASAAPAWASGANAVPEPGDIGLFALGVAGLLIGRRVSRRTRPPEPIDDGDA